MSIIQIIKEQMNMTERERDICRYILEKIRKNRRNVFKRIRACDFYKRRFRNSILSKDRGKRFS